MGDFWAKPVQADSDAFAQRFVYVERTPLFRFPDILNVQFLDTGNGTSTLVLHSASVFGQSDLGKNQERVEDLLKRMSDLRLPTENQLVISPRESLTSPFNMLNRSRRSSCARAGLQRPSSGSTSASTTASAWSRQP